MRVFAALAMLVLLSAVPSAALEIQRPDPALSPAQVVSIQLKALKNNDEPRLDAGIKQTYALAHPDNKRLTGPLPKFTQMLEGPLYRMMLNHRQHRIEQVSQTGDKAVFGVTILGKSGQVFKFLWTVRKIGSGEDAGAWATSAVSPPQTSEDSI
jgi:hypothetical protein